MCVARTLVVASLAGILAVIPLRFVARRLARRPRTLASALREVRNRSTNRSLETTDGREAAVRVAVSHIPSTHSDTCDKQSRNEISRSEVELHAASAQLPNLYRSINLPEPPSGTALSEPHCYLDTCLESASGWWLADEEAESCSDVRSCKTEKEFIVALEKRIAVLRCASPRASVRDWVHASMQNSNGFCPQEALYRCTQSPPQLTVWEYRDLFEPERKVDIALYEEFIDFVNSCSPTSSVDGSENSAKLDLFAPLMSAL